MKRGLVFVILLCLVAMVWISTLQFSDFSSQDAILEKHASVLNEEPTPTNNLVTSESLPVCFGKERIASSVSSFEQCSALGDGFVSKLASYIDRFSCQPRARMEKVLMYSCESDREGHFCGGMGDRFRGMITVFYLALLSNRRFEIFHPTPMPIEELLEPHAYNFVPFHPRDSRSSVSTIPVDQNLMKLQRHRKFLRKLETAGNANVLRVQSNSPGIDSFFQTNSFWARRKEEFGLSKSCNISCYFGCLHRVLFRPSLQLLKIVGGVLPPQKFIAVQVRMGGSWAPGMRVAEPFRTPPNAVEHFIFILQELRRVKNWEGIFESDPSWMRNSSIFVSSDSPRLIKEVSIAFNSSVRWIDGGFGHTDTLNLGDVKPVKYHRIDQQEIRETYSLTLANHFILSHGSHFVMAQSGFGDTAFWRTRRSATCLFVDMTNLRYAWQHHLAYSAKGSSAIAIRNRIVDLNRPPQEFYNS